MSEARPADLALQQAVALHQAGRLAEAEALYHAVLATRPVEVNALHLLGVLRQQQGRADEALVLLGQALGLAPRSAIIHGNYGNALKDLGRFGEAAAQYRQALALEPGFTDARYNLARLLKERGDFAEAADAFAALLAAEPGSAELHNDLALTLQALGRNGEAIRHFRAALECAPDQAVLHYNLGAALLQAADPSAADPSLRRALALDPGLIPAMIALGDTVRALDRADEAAAYYRAALAKAPADATALNNLGLALLQMVQPENAAEALARAAALRPDQPAIRVNCGNALQRLGHHEAALAEYRAALALDPASADARNNLAGALSSLGRRDEAAAEYAYVIETHPDFADARFNLGNVLIAVKRFDAAAAVFRGALAIDSSHAAAAGGLLAAKRFACDWDGFDADVATLGRLIETESAGADPFAALCYPLSPQQHRRCAEAAVRRRAGRIVPFPARSGRRDGPIRLAYLSANYHGHAVASLIAELIERHDRSRFEVTGISFGRDDGSALRQRLVQGFDRFIDVRGESDEGVARRLAALDIDIAVDLMGHTLDHRLGILAFRPAPVQVGFLGYPGTTGAAFIDYVVADPVVLPRDRQHFWTEQIVHLPGCYQVNDAHRPIPADRPSRAGCGLPEAGFVFCCFNNNYKITPEVFGLWLRLLAAVPDSVLWLLRDNDDAARRLAAVAAAHGLDPARLVFASVVGAEPHLARHRAADLFLDTTPYNAHTTASDALRMGLPLVTCLGTSFAARVAASLLTALDLPELITPDLAAYEALALALARDPARLHAVRQKLEHRAGSAALFDGDRFRIGVESAYLEMMARHRDGLVPAGFAVPAG